ncbi:hypothetical protein OC845_001592 [Tilletia horrida]|nr:hypothetical protein OC845_001592 [Tilletia horrida]
MGISLYSSGTETPMSSRTFLTDGGYYAACSDPAYLSSKHQDCQDGLSYLHGSDDFLYSDDLEFLQHVHEQQQSRRRRGKFVAQRKPRAGEAMTIPEQKVPSNSKGKGRELNPEESRRGRRQTKTSKMSSQTAVLVERDLKTVSRADEPPRAYMEVHTLFVRPPASIFEQQEREKRRAARLERRSDLNRIKEEEGVEEQLGNVSKVKLESGAALKQRKRKSPRYLKYGPETSAWTFQYQDGLASTEGVDMKAVKAEADETKPPAKRKRGRKRIPDALEVALETGAPLHPWAAPVQRSSASLSKAETDDGSLDGESSSSRAATRQGFDLFGRACEFPMATVQPSYTKILRERYRGFAAPGRARLDLEGLWAHRVRVWQAEQLGTWIPGGGGGGPPYLSNVSAAPPIFLRRNAIAGEQLAVKWDYEDEESC